MVCKSQHAAFISSTSSYTHELKFINSRHYIENAHGMVNRQ